MSESQFTYPNSKEFEPRSETESSVAIVMRTKDRPVLLVRAICSVINQNFTDWHLFIVNDGGDPGTLDETIKPYLSKLSGKLSVINNEAASGRSGAGNAVLGLFVKTPGETPPAEQEKIRQRAKKCAFCVIHDDDDSWNPDFLLETVSFLERPENKRFGGVCTKAVLVEEEIRGDSVFYTKERPFWPHVSDIDFWEILKENRVLPIAFLFRTEILNFSGILNNEMPVIEDWDLALRMLRHADIAFLEKVLAYYHHRTGLTSGVNGNSVIAEDSVHKEYRKTYDAAIYRESIRGNAGNFGLFFALANLEAKMKKEIAGTFWKIEALQREVYWVHQKLDKISNTLGIQNTIKKKTLLKRIDSFCYQKFFKHLLKLFNIPKPPPDKKKNFLKRLDSFFYQVFFKHILNIFKQ